MYATRATQHHAIYAKLVLTAALWGGTFVAGGMLTQQMHPVHAATGRFGVAAAILLALLAQQRRKLSALTLKLVAATCALGLTGAVAYNCLFFAALARIPASKAAVIVALNPMAVALGGLVLFGVAMSAAQWRGLVMSFAGATIVITQVPRPPCSTATQRPSALASAMLGAVASWAAYTLISRSVATRLSPIELTTYASCWGLVFLLALSAMLRLPQSDVSGFGLTLVTYLGIGGTVLPFIWYAQAVQTLGAAKAAVFLNLVPVFGVVLAVFFLGDQVHWSVLAGGSMTLAGIARTNRD